MNVNFSAIYNGIEMFNYSNDNNKTGFDLIAKCFKID